MGTGVAGFSANAGVAVVVTTVVVVAGEEGVEGCGPVHPADSTIADRMSIKQNIPRNFIDFHNRLKIKTVSI
jgi:hypothetical protein